MASNRYPLPEDPGKVRIPVKFLEGIEDFLHRLNRRIMDGAVQRAFARKTGPMAVS